MLHLLSVHIGFIVFCLFVQACVLWVRDSEAGRGASTLLQTELSLNVFIWQSV